MSARVVIYRLLWALPPIIMCGSWQYDQIGVWLIVAYWVIAIFNLQYHLDVTDATLTSAFSTQQYVICAAIIAQTLGVTWSWYHADPLIPLHGDAALLGPVAAGIGAAELAAIVFTGYLAVIAYEKIAARVRKGCCRNQSQEILPNA